MDSLLYRLKDDNTWLKYLDFKKKQISSTKLEIKQLEEYINNKRYKDIVNDILNNNYTFSIPYKHLINKINSDKKRVVYSFNEDENMILKIITYLFSLEYDKKYSKNCYSFRKKNGPKEAIKKLYNSNINNLYGYKIDIKNYFNSIDINILFNKLDLFIDNDLLLLGFIKNILSNPYVNFNNEIIKEKKGIMAGIPISSFLANIYLKELDDYFNDILYIRYSDDIIIFSDKDNLDKYINILNNKIKEFNLEINKDKVTYIKPNDKFDFLGFSFKNNKIDLSNISKQKIKSKIKRTSKKLRKWMINNNTSSERAIKAVIRKFNRKFFSLSNNELTWELWYFPVINTIDSLHEIDLYLQDNLRYINTGKHNKKNYNLKYSTLKEYGYKSLVNEYYKFKKNM